MWRPTPILSIGKSRYYARLVDDFSKYTWIILWQYKFDFLFFFTVYIFFEQYVTKQFNKQIKNFHSDGGGKFINSKLSYHFLFTETIHQVSYSYSSEQIAMVERSHRIIGELGMTMSFHTGTSIFLWVDAFITTVYLMNHLPSFVFNFETLYFTLHGTYHVYSSLRIFCSKCFPYT